jgi:hypothetical protein
MQIEVVAWTIYLIEARVILVKSWYEKLHQLPKRGFLKTSARAVLLAVFSHFFCNSGASVVDVK